MSGLPPNDQVAPPWVSAWIAGPPALRDQPELLVSLTDDLLSLLAPFPIGPIYSSEPREYRLTTRGRSSLANAIRADRINTLVFATSPQPPLTTGLNRATALLALSSRQNGDQSTQLQLQLRPADPARFAPLARQVIDFVTRWFAELGAASAFVSTYNVTVNGEIGDSPVVTAHERRRGAIATGWTASCRYIRGAFWGTGLGSELCARLGGRERVLHDAPVEIARAVNDGVWLQVSNGIPAEDALVRLAAFLSPVLDWAASDILGANAEGRRQWEATRPETAADDLSPLLLEAMAQARAQVSTEASVAGRNAVPIRGLGQFLDELGVDVAINIQLSEPPTRQQLAQLMATLYVWYEAGFQGEFGGKGFHDLTGPTIDGRVVRWHADLGSADGERAVKELAGRLARVRHLTVRRLVLGTDSAG